MSNIMKWVRLCFVGCGVLTWVFFRTLADFLFDFFNLFAVRWIAPPADIVGIVVGFVLFMTLVRSEKASTYLELCLVELSKVTWPKAKESAMSTGVVGILVGIATLIIVVMNALFNMGAEKLYQ